MATENMIAWAAGVFEGEGCFFLSRKNSPRCCVSMTDEDVVRKFHATVVIGRFCGPYKNSAKNGRKRKPIWRWVANGYENMQTIRDLFRPYLCIRRSARADEILSKRKKEKPRPPPCGKTIPRSQNGYRAHRISKEEPCSACLDAYSEYMRSFRKVGGGRSNRSITQDLICEIFDMCESGAKRSVVSARFGVCLTSVSKIYRKEKRRRERERILSVRETLS